MLLSHTKSATCNVVAVCSTHTFCASTASRRCANQPRTSVDVPGSGFPLRTVPVMRTTSAPACTCATNGWFKCTVPSSRTRPQKGDQMNACSFTGIPARSRQPTCINVGLQHSPPPPHFFFPASDTATGLETQDAEQIHADAAYAASGPRKRVALQCPGAAP
eukprot:3938040-Rhodomonas_salina.1